MTNAPNNLPNRFERFVVAARRTPLRGIRLYSQLYITRLKPGINEIAPHVEQSHYQREFMLVRVIWWMVVCVLPIAALAVKRKSEAEILSASLAYPGSDPWSKPYCVINFRRPSGSLTANTLRSYMDNGADSF